MKTLVLHINGIFYESCIEHLTTSLKALKGVSAVEVDVMSHSARVEHDESVCTPRDLVAAVQHVGFQVDGFTSPDPGTR